MTENRAAHYLLKAEQAFLQAEATRDPAIRAAYFEIAKQWRDLARQAMELDRK